MIPTKVRGWIMLWPDSIGEKPRPVMMSFRLDREAIHWAGDGDVAPVTMFIGERP